MFETIGSGSGFGLKRIKTKVSVRIRFNILKGFRFQNRFFSEQFKPLTQIIFSSNYYNNYHSCILSIQRMKDLRGVRLFLKPLKSYKLT